MAAPSFVYGSEVRWVVKKEDAIITLSSDMKFVRNDKIQRELEMH
jgi:hypothetical protein